MWEDESASAKNDCGRKENERKPKLRVEVSVVNYFRMNYS